MAIDFTPIEEFDASDFLGEFPASQVTPLVDAFNILVNRHNALLDAIEIAGTAKFLKEKTNGEV